MNNFLALRQADIADFSQNRQEVVRQRVETRLRSAEFIGNLIELFGPVMADTLTVMGGGQPVDERESYLTIEGEADDDFPYGGEDDDTPEGPPPGPGARNEIIR